MARILSTLGLLVAFAASVTLGPGVVAIAEAQTPVAVAAPSAIDIANRIEGFYGRVTTFKASFKQRYKANGSSKAKDNAGIVFLEKPGKASWRYSNNGNRIVADGSRVKVYEPNNKQMYDLPAEGSVWSAVLAFVGGSGNLDQSFKLTKLSSTQSNFAGLALLAEPRKPSPACAKMVLYVDPTTYQVRRVLVSDAADNRSRFDFSQIEVNLVPPAGEFLLTPPPGTVVIQR